MNKFTYIFVTKAVFLGIIKNIIIVILMKFNISLFNLKIIIIFVKKEKID